MFLVSNGMLLGTFTNKVRVLPVNCLDKSTSFISSCLIHSCSNNPWLNFLLSVYVCQCECSQTCFVLFLQEPNAASLMKQLWVSFFYTCMRKLLVVYFKMSYTFWKWNFGLKSLLKCGFGHNFSSVCICVLVKNVMNTWFYKYILFVVARFCCLVKFQDLNIHNELNIHFCLKVIL